LEYSGAFGILCGNLVCIFTFWYIFPRKIWQPNIRRKKGNGGRLNWTLFMPFISQRMEYSVLWAHEFKTFHISPFISARDQGDQIGRKFAQWVIAYFWQLCENYKSIPHILATFSICEFQHTF
jgi:hypothetical protein